MRMQIDRVEGAFGGVSFGAVGAYEKIVGRFHGEADPNHPLDRPIVNLDKAPRNAAGRVDYWVDFCLLKPVDLSLGNRHLLYDTSNRGDKLALIDLNGAEKGPTSNDPVSAADAGNGFLMRRGYSILFSAWQGGVADEEQKMLAGFPVATDHGAPIVAVAREEIMLGHTEGPAPAPLSYPAHTTEQSAATLSVRQHERDPRQEVPRTRWRYLSPTLIEIDPVASFGTGALYEFIYPARDPIVMGLGFVAVRDVVAFMRREARDEDGNENPLSSGGGAPAAECVIAYGRSQPGRLLREFVRLGFNEDREGRPVFDGIYVSIAGSRRIDLNAPFAQPGRFQRQHEDHLYPGDQFPFTYATRKDPRSGETDGILARATTTNTCPKVIHVDSSTEFWQGRSSLLVTDEDGRDIAMPEEVRCYLFAGTQHAGPVMMKHAGIFSQDPVYPLNHVDYAPLNRALIAALDTWASGGEAPPESRFPRVDDGTLVPPFPQETQGFPEIPGVRYPALINELSARNYETQPPTPIAGTQYRLLVPKVDADGNEIAGIRLPEVAVPRATYTGWNLRDRSFAEGALMVVGSCFPFAATRAERSANGDPRPSLEERYPSHGDYAAAVRDAAEALQRERLLLAEDVERCVADAEALAT